MSTKYSFPKEKIRILLLEGVHPSASAAFRESGYEARAIGRSPGEAELIDSVRGLHVLGIRSKTRLPASVIDASDRLLAIGCFCIGTDQVDLAAAARRGIPVFNAPFSNTRSVAELAIAEVVMLARRTAQRSAELHRGLWRKSAAGSREVRGKTLGIVGYGHIGTQVGVLAEALGMRVVFYDIVNKLPMGNAVQLGSLRELLEVADFATLHVPETSATRNMVGGRQLGWMKPGSCLLNLSRGSVVDLKALRAELESGHLDGAAVDVFPEEPGAGESEFDCMLRGLPNVILTPHIGGSTEEAQRAIGLEVSGSLVRYLDTGSSIGAVNFPQLDLPVIPDAHRVLNIHRNVPGVLSNINRIIAETGGNISSQYLGTQAEIGYLIMDVEQRISGEVKRKIDQLDTTIRTRLLF